MNFKRHLNKRIRLVEGTDPNATGTGVGGSEGSTGSAASTTQQEPTITQAQLDAIISRKLAKEREKLEAAQKAAEDARKLAEETEKRVNEAREKGISFGLLQAKRNAIAEQYGLSADLLPAEEDKLDAFEKQLATSINSRTRVTPVTVEPATKTPDWMGAAHA
jgi:flagellar biosynthesis/type III secretory pathway protein FliH|nr:MAG TPA: Major head protein [Caudoviricetes sp.]